MNRLFRKYSAVAFASLASLLTSCGAMKDIPLSDAGALKGKSVVRVTRDKPSLLAYTPGKAAAGAVFGAIGGAVAASAMVSAGNEIVNKNGVEDPAVAVSKELTAGLVKHYGMKNAGEVHLKTVKPNEIAKAASSADYSFDVRTTGWAFMYLPMHLGTYRVIYGSQLRLIDNRSGKVVAQGFLSRDPHEDEHSYDYDALVGNGAAGLKKESKLGGDAAKNHFKSSILKF